MKPTLLYLSLIFSLGFVQAQESAAVYLSFTSKYESQFDHDEKDIEHSLFLALRSWLSTYADAVSGKGIDREDFIKTFHSKASISGEVLHRDKKLNPETYADLLSKNSNEPGAFQLRKIKLAALENPKEDKYVAFLNFDQGSSSNGQKNQPFHGVIEVEKDQDETFKIRWKNIKSGYWSVKEPLKSEHFFTTSAGISGYNPEVDASNIQFGNSWFASLGYLWQQPLSSQSRWSFLGGGQVKYISSQVQLSENSFIQGRGTPNALQLNFISPSAEIQQRISGELHLGLDWTFGSTPNAQWGVSALFTPRFGQVSYGHFEGLVEYTEVWDDRVLIRDIINCGLGTFGGDDAQTVSFSERSFLFQPGFLLRPRWKSKAGNWGRLQIGLDAQIFPAMGETESPEPFLQSTRGIIESESTQLRYRDETLHQTLSQGRTEWYAGVHLAYSFPSSTQRQSKVSEYDDLFSQEQKSGYEGKAYLILNGDISDAEAAERIRQDLGPATQFVWVINTTQLTNVEIPTMKELLSIKVNNNKALERISFADLNQAIDEIEVNNNGNLNEFNAQSLKKLFNAQFHNNDSLNKLEFPSVESIEGRFSVTENDHLNEIRFSVLKEMYGSFYFSDNDALSEVDFPLLKVAHQDITIDNNPELKTVEWLSLSGIGGSIYVTGNSNLDKLKLPNLEEVSDHLNIQNNKSLEVFRGRNLSHIGGDFLISSNENIKSIDIPRLNRIEGNISFSFNPSMQQTDWPVLEHVGGDIIINAQDSLSSISFNDLSEVKGNILLQNNRNLFDIHMPSLLSLSGAFELQGAFSDSLFLPELKESGGIQLGSNLNLKHVGIPNLVVLKTSPDNANSSTQPVIAINQNSSLSEIYLPKLAEIYGEVEVTNNQQLRELKVPALLLISSAVRLSNLNSFVDFEAPRLEKIEGDFMLKSNDNFKVLRLPALLKLGGLTEISYNSNLRRIEFPELNTINGHFIATHNSLQTTTIDSLLQTLASQPPPSGARIRFNLQRPAATPSWKGLRASRQLKRDGYDIVTD